MISMRLTTTLLTIVLIALLLTTASAPPETLRIVNESVHTLDETAIQAAAQPLLDRDARVALFLSSSGDEEDFNERMEAAGLGNGSGGSANEDVIAIYVSSDPGYSEIRWGD